MRGLVEELPAQLRWAAAMDVGAVPGASAAIVAGMGGSGIAGDVAAVVAEATGSRVAVHKAYDLPAWVAADDLVVAVSHSGDTEETGSAMIAALAGGNPVVGVSTGGVLAERAAKAGLPWVEIPAGAQPRAAFGHLAGAVVRVLEKAGIVGPQGSDLLEAADVVEGILDGDGPDVAGEMADALTGRFTVVYGGTGIPAVAANRWKTQINENSKAPAAWVTLPEADHNDIVGWSAYPDLSADAVGAVFLHDSGDHPRTTLRGRLTRTLMSESVAIAGVVESRGTGTIARLFSLAVIGDLVSVALADRSGTDPIPVHILENLKARLAQESQ